MIKWNDNPGYGAIAYCGIGCLGLITSKEMEEVMYPDGNKAMAWTGIHLTDKKAKIGSPWSSTKPRVVGRLEDGAVDELCIGLKNVLR